VLLARALGLRPPPPKVQPAVELFARVDNLCDASYQEGAGLSTAPITAGCCGRPQAASLGLGPTLAGPTLVGPNHKL